MMGTYDEVAEIQKAARAWRGEGNWSDFLGEWLRRAMLAAAPTPPNPIACHVDESCGQGGGEVEIVGYAGRNALNGFMNNGTEVSVMVKQKRFYDVPLTPLENVTRLQADFKAKYQDHKRDLQKAWDERDALKAEVERLQQLVSQSRDDADEADRLRHVAQSRLTQATAIIDYQWLHTELDAIEKTDIDKFYAGSTDAEKAARAEMVRVANEPVEGGL